MLLTKLIILFSSAYFNSATNCKFHGVVVGAVHKKYDITLNYGGKELRGQTEDNGKFELQIWTGPPSDKTIGPLSVKINYSHQSDNNEKQRQKRWRIAELKCQNWHIFYFGQFLPKLDQFGTNPPSLFLRVKFSPDFPKALDGHSYVLRLGYSEGTTTTNTTVGQVYTTNVANWQAEEEGVQVKLDEKGIRRVKGREEPKLTIEIVQVKLEVCWVCHFAFHEKELARKLANCMHFAHPDCANKWLKIGQSTNCYCGAPLEAQGENASSSVVQFADKQSPPTEHSLFSAELRMPVLQNGEEQEEAKFAYEFDAELVSIKDPAKVAKVLDGQTLKVIDNEIGTFWGESNRNSYHSRGANNFEQFNYNLPEPQQQTDYYEPSNYQPFYDIGYFWEDMKNHHEREQKPMPMGTNGGHNSSDPSADRVPYLFQSYGNLQDNWVEREPQHWQRTEEGQNGGRQKRASELNAKTNIKTKILSEMLKLIEKEVERRRKEEERNEEEDEEEEEKEETKEEENEEEETNEEEDQEEEEEVDEERNEEEEVERNEEEETKEEENEEEERNEEEETKEDEEEEENEEEDEDEEKDEEKEEDEDEKRNEDEEEEKDNEGKEEKKNAKGKYGTKPTSPAASAAGDDNDNQAKKDQQKASAGQIKSGDQQQKKLRRANANEMRRAKLVKEDETEEKPEAPIYQNGNDIAKRDRTSTDFGKDRQIGKKGTEEEEKQREGGNSEEMRKKESIGKEEGPAVDQTKHEEMAKTMQSDQKRKKGKGGKANQNKSDRMMDQNVVEEMPKNTGIFWRKSDNELDYEMDSSSGFSDDEEAIDKRKRNEEHKKQLIEMNKKIKEEMQKIKTISKDEEKGKKVAEKEGIFGGKGEGKERTEMETHAKIGDKKKEETREKEIISNGKDKATDEGTMPKANAKTKAKANGINWRKKGKTDKEEEEEEEEEAYKKERNDQMEEALRKMSNWYKENPTKKEENGTKG